VKVGMRDSFGIMQPSGKLGEKQNHCRVSMKELEARRQQNASFYCYLGSAYH